MSDFAKDTNVPTNDCVSRQAAIDALCSECQGNCVHCDSFPCGEVQAIQSLPSAQPEPSQVARDIATIIENEKDMRVIASAQPDIVRCKDCKHRDTDDCPMRFVEWIEWDDDGYTEYDDVVTDNTVDDGYCNFAEREENR